MSGPATLFSVEALLRPIREDAPAGESLRYSATYDAIVEARRLDADLPQGVWQRKSKKADWREVEKLCTAALETRTKDLQIAVWLSEAWVYHRRLAGLVASVQLLDGLHRYFLTTMYPTEVRGGTLTEDAVEHRANLIQNFSERSAFALKFVPLCEPPDTEAHCAYALADVEQLHHDDSIRRKMNLPVPAEKPLQALEESIVSTPVAWLVAMDAHLQEAEAVVARLEATLDASYGAQNGGLGELSRVLGAMRLFLRPRLPLVPEPMRIADEAVHVPFEGQEQEAGILAKVRQLFSPGQQEAAESGYDSSASTTAQSDVPELMAPSLVATGPFPVHAAPASRQEAYQRLREVADFLARTEPHSPVPFLLRRAIRWGSMDLSDLLPEMMRNPQGIEELNDLLRLHTTE